MHRFVFCCFRICSCSFEDQCGVWWRLRLPTVAVVRSRGTAYGPSSWLSHVKAAVHLPDLHDYAHTFMLCSSIRSLLPCFPFAAFQVEFKCLTNPRASMVFSSGGSYSELLPWIRKSVFFVVRFPRRFGYNITLTECRQFVGRRLYPRTWSSSFRNFNPRKAILYVHAQSR